MGRPKRYETIAAKQKAYRERRKTLVPVKPVETTIDQLRELIKVEHEKPVVEPTVPVMRVYRSETGMAISREQWEERKEEKRKAAERGFEYDEYSQT